MLCLCGEPVLRVGHPPVLLDREPHPLGIYAPDGTRLETRDILRAGRSHRGWRHHECRATTDDVPALFQVVE